VCCLDATTDKFWRRPVQDACGMLYYWTSLQCPGGATVKNYLLVATVLAAIPAAAGAQEINAQEGFYVGAGGFANWFIGNQNGVSTSTGWAVSGRAGYDFVGPRAEVEVGYGEVPVSANIPGTAINNRVGALTAMANVLYDFMPTSVITPYIGGGLGIAFIDSN